MYRRECEEGWLAILELEVYRLGRDSTEDYVFSLCMNDMLDVITWTCSFHPLRSMINIEDSVQSYFGVCTDPTTDDDDVRRRRGWCRGTGTNAAAAPDLAMGGCAGPKSTHRGPMLR